MFPRKYRNYFFGLFFGLLPSLIILMGALTFISRRFSGSAVGRAAGWAENAARGNL